MLENTIPHTLWTSSSIASAVNGKAGGAWAVADISIDSRTVKAGDLFIALKGPNFDGHAFVADALKKGAAGALVEKVPDGVAAEQCIPVADTFAALQALGKAGRARMKGTVIGVTGSVGKTGCKEALRQVLAAQAPTFANPGSFNNHWGAPLSLARMPEKTRYGVFELGMNHVGELGPLSQMVCPHIALITTIAPVHIGNFNGLDEIAGAKAEIFDGVEASGHAVLNADNPYFTFLKERAEAHGLSAHGFGTHEKATARILNTTLEAEGSTVTLSLMGRTLTYRVAAPGEHWVMNSAAVLLAATLAGANAEKATATLGTLQLAYGRGTAKKILLADGPVTLIDESYNASPIAVEMAIKVLARKAPESAGRRVLVLGDMRELGEHSSALHLALAPKILEAGIDTVFCCGEHMKHLYDTLPPGKRGAYAFTAAELAPLVATAIRPHDIITVKGSRSVATDKVVDALLALSPSPRTIA